MRVTLDQWTWQTLQGRRPRLTWQAVLFLTAAVVVAIPLILVALLLALAAVFVAAMGLGLWYVTRRVRALFSGGGGTSAGFGRRFDWLRRDGRRNVVVLPRSD